MKLNMFYLQQQAGTDVASDQLNITNIHPGNIFDQGVHHEREASR
jgi:hypothetical protein